MLHSVRCISWNEYCIQDIEIAHLTTNMLMGVRVAILVEFNYEDLELHYPLLRLRRAPSIGCCKIIVGWDSDQTRSTAGS